MNNTRIGIGFDFHRFEEAGDDNHIMLCGVSVPCKYKVVAHSDGDLVLHALTDAILGAIGEGDIGIHFPPSDIKWKDKESKHFLLFAKDLLDKQGGTINNIDMVIVTETPKISLYRDQFIAYLSKTLSIKPSQVSVKAKTMEGVGVIGSREGIACQVVVSVSDG